MAERFQSLFRTEENLYTPGSPIIIRAGALLKDSQTGRVLVQLKLCNITNKVIKACKVCIRAYESNGSEVMGLPEASYLDLHAARDDDFGSKQPLYLPNANTRSFTAAVTEVVFTDGSVWNREACPWEVLPKLRTLSDAYADVEMAKQYEIEVGYNASYAPIQIHDLAYCTCGAVNREDEEVCHACGKNMTHVMATYLNRKILQEKCDARLRDEAELRARQEEQRKKEEEERRRAEAEHERIAAQEHKAAERRIQKRKKNIIAAMIALAVVAVAIWAALIFLVPLLQYNEAAKLHAEGRYGEAVEIYESLGGL